MKEQTALQYSWPTCNTIQSAALLIPILTYLLTLSTLTSLCPFQCHTILNCFTFFFFICSTINDLWCVTHLFCLEIILYEFSFIIYSWSYIEGWSIIKDFLMLLFSYFVPWSSWETNEHRKPQLNTMCYRMNDYNFLNNCLSAWRRIVSRALYFYSNFSAVFLRIHVSIFENTKFRFFGFLIFTNYNQKEGLKNQIGII